MPDTVDFNLVAETYVGTRKNHERAGLMPIRVEVKNEIHMLLNKYDLTYGYTDLFGKQGLDWLTQTLLSIDPRIVRRRESSQPLASPLLFEERAHLS